MTDLSSAEPIADAAGDATSQAVVEMRDIRVSFGGVHAVNGVSSTCTRARSSRLVGGNGAGKSTLIHTLAGPTRPTRARS